MTSVWSVCAAVLTARSCPCLVLCQVWDLRKNEVVDEYQGHNDTITGLSLSPDG